MAQFRIGDLVKIVGAQPLAQCTGRIIALTENGMYEVEINQTGLIYRFSKTHLEFIARALTIRGFSRNAHSAR